MRLVIFGYGNASRGDDASGPELLARIAAAGLPDIVTVEDFQLQIEHALDLQGAGLALFIDAGTGTPAPFSFYEIAPQARPTHTSHALAPESVLDVCQRIGGMVPPPAFVLCVRGESFALGEGMSVQGMAHLEAAWSFLQRLTAAADPQQWRALATALHAPLPSPLAGETPHIGGAAAPPEMKTVGDARTSDLCDQSWGR